MPSSEAVVSRGGDRLTIEPVGKEGLAAPLERWEPLDEEFPKIGDPPPMPKDIF